MERIVKVYSAYDKRHSDPKKNYGIHGCNLLFVLKGKHGATQFLIYTNWHLPHVQKELEQKSSLLSPLPADFGYHSKIQQYEGQASMGECDWCDGEDCYYDGSGLYAQTVFDRMTKEGDSAIWEELETSYKERFGELV